MHFDVSKKIVSEKIIGEILYQKDVNSKVKKSKRKLIQQENEFLTNYINRTVLISCFYFNLNLNFLWFNKCEEIILEDVIGSNNYKLY